MIHFYFYEALLQYLLPQWSSCWVLGCHYQVSLFHNCWCCFLFFFCFFAITIWYKVVQNNLPIRKYFTSFSNVNDTTIGQLLGGIIILRGPLWFFNCFDMKHTYLRFELLIVGLSIKLLFLLSHNIEKSKHEWHDKKKTLLSATKNIW